MADKSHDNRISGYLDDQLTPEERADVEAAMRDPETQRLLSELSQQSNELKSLPKFSLGQDLSERILSDVRVDAAFDSMNGPGQGSVDVGPQAYPVAKRYGSAVAAIVSLAAMVLVAIFLPQTISVQSELAKADDDVADVKVSESLFDKSEPAAILELDVMKLDAAKPKDVAAGFDAQSESEGFFRAGGKALERSPLQDQTRNEAPQKFLGEARDAASSKVAPGMQPLGRGNVERSMPVLARETADETKGVALSPQQPGQGQRMRALGVEKIAEESTEPIPAEDQLAMPAVKALNEKQKIVGRDFLGVPALSSRGFRDVIEVHYSGGPEMLVEFQKSLSQNSIQFNDAAFEELVAGNARVRMANRGFGAKQPKRQEGANPSDKAAREKDLMFGITATPAQVEKFVEHLNKRASVFSLFSTKKQSELTSQPPMAGKAVFEGDVVNGGVGGRNPSQNPSQSGRAEVLTRSRISNRAASMQDAPGANVLGKRQQEPQAAAFEFKSSNNQPSRYLFIVRIEDDGAESVRSLPARQNR